MIRMLSTKRMAAALGPLTLSMTKSATENAKTIPAPIHAIRRITGRLWALYAHLNSLLYRLGKSGNNRKNSAGSLALSTRFLLIYLSGGDPVQRGDMNA